MEEILASIRRIIAEDDPEPVIQSQRPAAAAPAPAPVAAPLPPPAAAVSTEAIDALFAVKPPAPTPAAARPTVVPPPSASAPIPTPTLAPAATGPSAPPPSRPAFAAAPPKTELPFRRESRAAAAPEPARKEEHAAGRPLLSPGTDAIVNAAFGSLSGNVPTGNVKTGSSQTLEDLVKEMLRPMLKTWLDTNLPPLVERLVRDEIERVSRGR